MATIASETYTSTSAPIQYAAIRAFQGGEEIENYLKQSRRVLSVLAQVITGRLQKAGFDIDCPHGGFYLFLDFKPFTTVLNNAGIVNSIQLCETLLDATGVATLPGESFGRPLNELSMRIAFVDFDGHKVLQAAEKYPGDQPLPEGFCLDYTADCITAIDLLCDWVKGL